MELNLKNTNWKEFVFENIFSINSTNSGIDKNKLILNKGNIPYITRTDKNNGIDCFVGKQNDKYKIEKKNVITIGLDTQTVFYQEYEFYTGQNIQILKCDKLNKNNANFLIPLIKKQMEKFNWGGNGATLTRLKRSKILLPTNTNGEPDFTFMEAYIKLLKEEKLKLYLNHIDLKISSLNANSGGVKPLNEKEWYEFEIGKLFKLYPGKSKGLNHLKKSNHGVNYLGATNLNNGVLACVQSEGNENKIQKGNCIAFIRNGEGSMGYSVYKTESFIATSDITVGYSEKLNREIGLFITTIADRIRGKYNFGYKRSDTRLKKEKIQLPVNSKNEPDYEYMENYVKRIEFEKLNKYIQKING